MKRILFVLALLPLLLATACADDDLQPRRNETDLEALHRLVPITQTGAGTFGCLLNGELWIPEMGESLDDKVDIVLSNPHLIEMTARKRPVSDARDHLITIGCFFKIDDIKPLSHITGWNDRDGSGECSRMFIDTFQENYMIVNHFDQINKTISGLFIATMTNPDCPQDTIKITEGRFDLPYRD